MANFHAIQYQDSTQHASALSQARALAALAHRLLGGDRTETLDLSRLSPRMRQRAEAKLAAGQLGRTTGYSTPVLVPTDPDDPDAGGEILLIIEDNLQAEIAADAGRGQPRLTGPERAQLQAAVSAAQSRGAR